MDLALNFSSPALRNHKFEPPYSLFRNNSYDKNALNINIPMESDSSNSMFDSSGGCRVTRWPFPNYNSNYMSRSTQLNKSGPSIQKIMVPKIPSISISISHQTIVGGFVGSKSHAGRSLFGDSNQIWDAIICNFVEIMSLGKENAAVDVPRSKTPIHSNKYSSECTSGVPSEKNPHIIAPRDNSSVSENSFSISSKMLDPCIIELSSNAEIMTEARQNSPRCEMSPISNAVVPQFHKPTILCKNIPSPQKKTYSSIVDGTCKNKGVQTESCIMVNLKSKGMASEIHEDSSPLPPKQSYADVAKIIPHKAVVHQNKSGCEMANNLKMWSSKTKGNINSSRSNWEKKVVKQNKSCRTYYSGDIFANGCTRWKDDWKLKRAKFQNRRPMAMSIKNQNCPNTKGGAETGVNEMNTKEDISLSEPESNLLKEVKELARAEHSNKNYRGRYSSECSLDSDDSFVVFEDCPDSTSSTSLQSFDHNPSLEEDKLVDDYISSSSDDSDSEDDCVDIILQHADLNYMACSPHKRKFCEWENKCSAPTIPESKFKGIQKKTVHFAEGSHLAVVRPMIAWGYAYRESRRGPWEVHARDRARFHFRIESLAPVLNLVLDPRHRRRVLASRFSNHVI